MKKIFIPIILVLVLVLGYLLLKGDAVEQVGETTKYSSVELGLEFEYQTGATGYVLDERIPADLGELVRVLILQKSEDAERTPPVGGEGAPTITISIFHNTQRQSSSVWAGANPQYSNLNLKMGDVFERVVGGANAISYRADGLYGSQNVVVAHGSSIYVLTGQFMDEESELYRDFSPLVESVRFVSQVSVDDIPAMQVAEGIVFGEEEIGRTIRSTTSSPSGQKVAVVYTNGVHDFAWVYDAETDRYIPIAFQYGGGVEMVRWESDTKLRLKLTTPKPETVEKTFDLEKLSEYPKVR